MRIDWDQVEGIIRDDLGGRKAEPGVGCPAPEDLVRLFEQGASRKARATMMEHVANCADCARILKSVIRLSGEVDRLTGTPETVQSCPPEPLQKKGARPRPPLGRRTAVLALAALAGLTIITVSVIKLSERPVVRGIRGLEIKLISPKKGASLAADDIKFVWEAVPKASRYFVELFGRSLEKVWRSGPLSAPMADLPADVRSTVQEGETYFWRVTAVLEDGQEIVSKLAEFSIRKSPA